MKYSFDLNDKNVEYALVQLASKLDVDICRGLLASYVTAKSKNERLELVFDTGSLYELLLIYTLLEYAPDNEHVKNTLLTFPIGDISRRQLNAFNEQTSLDIQRNIQSLLILANKIGLGVFVSDGLATWGRTSGFCNDDRFNLLVEKYSSLLPLPNWHWNLSVAKWCVESALKLDGDLVELGVFKGHTTAFVAEYVDFSKYAKNWYLYDTFAGIPVEDMNNESWIETNRLSYGDTYSYEEVADRFKSYPNIHVIQGRVPDVFRDHPPPPRIAFLHVDLNSAKAEVAALDYLFASIVAGGIVLFDDYGWAVCDEQHQAIDTWAKQRSLSVLELPTGQGLLVVISQKNGDDYLNA